MASALSSSIQGSRGGAPSGVQGPSPWSGVRGRSPPEADAIFIVRYENFALLKHLDIAAKVTLNYSNCMASRFYQKSIFLQLYTKF